MTDWFIRLQGTEFDLKILSLIFNSPDLNISKKEVHYYLYDKNFNYINDSNQVFVKSEHLIKILNGIAKIKQNNFKPVGVGGVMFYDENGSKHCYVHSSISASLRSSIFAKATVTDKNGKEKESNKKNDSIKWLEIANKDEKVTRALRFLSNSNLDWYDLYKIFEIVKKDIGIRTIEQWISPKSKIKDFTQTANSSLAIGEKARHADDIPAPKNPVSFGEAFKLISNIVKKWLETKSN